MITLEERVSINYEELIRDLLTCETCLNAYDQSVHLPKSLCCGHTLCEVCLENYCALPDTVEDGHFLCPMCREENKIENGFKADFRTNQLLDLIDRQGREVIPRCANHSPLELFFCETCDTLFCSLCDNTSHSVHKHKKHKHKVILSSVAIKQRLAVLHIEAGKCTTKLEEADKNVTHEIDKLKINVEQVSTDIKESFEVMRTFMNDREKDLLASAKRIHGDKLGILQNQLKVISSERFKVETEFKEFKFQGDVGDIANKMKELRLVTESVDSLLDPREKSSINYDNQNPDMKDFIQIYGAVRSS